MAAKHASFGEAADRLEAETVIRPAGDEPGDILGDGVDVFNVLFGGVRVVHAQVARATELPSYAEVQADGLGVTDVEVAVGFGRETGHHGADAPLSQVPLDDLADEVLTVLRLRILAGLTLAVGRSVAIHIRHRLPFYPVRRPAGARPPGSVQSGYRFRH